VIITLRRRIRSTQAPAGRPMTRNARNSNVVSSPTWNGVACRTFTASSGMASIVTMVPTWLIASPIHSRRKSAWNRRLSRFTTPACAPDGEGARLQPRRGRIRGTSRGVVAA
jgi:hypothetical protein